MIDIKNSTLNYPLSKVSNQEKEDLFKSMALLFKNGTPTDQALQVLADQTNSKTLKRSLLNVKEKVEAGGSIYDAIKNDYNFDTISVSFIKAGESSGSLTDNLFYLANWLKQYNKLIKDVKSATFYPKVVVTMAVIIGASMARFVLPRLIPIFTSLDVELPFTTQIFLNIYKFSSEYGYLFLIFIPIAVFAVFFLTRWKPSKRVLHKIILHLPVFGMISQNYQLAIIAQLSSILIQTGITINEILIICSESVSNLEYQRVLVEINDKVSQGINLADAMKEYPKFFPGVFVSMIATGEQAGTYEESFKYLSDFFTDKTKEQIDRLPIILEILLLCIIGLTIAFIATAIILPVYELTRGLN